MTIYLRAHSVTLELPLDMQRVDEGAALSGFRATMGGTSRMYRDVLKNVSFNAEEGDRIGLLGLNGAGKTTLLRVLNGAYTPTQGRVERKGSTQSLLNATLGFSEYASVMENVILRGTAMGLRRKQIEAALPDILDFAGLTEQALHRLHTLSSGQRMRLGFAISTAIQPDILLMDEWIATGDAAFIARAHERLRARFNDSRIVVLASHGMDLLRRMCNKAIVMHEGQLRYFGAMDEALVAYSELIARQPDSVRVAAAQSEPLLFGDATGFIERIRLDAGRLEVEGWAAGKSGSEVKGLTVSVFGKEHQIDEFERLDRSDVRLHLGKRSGQYGFRCVIQVPQGLTPDSYRHWLEVTVRSGLQGQVPLAVASNASVEIN